MGTSSAVNLQRIQYPGVTPFVHILSHDKCEVVRGSLFLDENRVNLIYSEIKACAYVGRYDRGTREVLIWNLVPSMVTCLYVLLVVKILF